MKFGTWINLNKLNLMVLFYTGNAFFGQFGLSIQNCFLKWNTVLRLIQNGELDSAAHFFCFRQKTFPFQAHLVQKT